MSLGVIADASWNLILRRVRDEKCVPFLGAGASLGFHESPGLPTASQLAEAVAREANYPGRDKTDLLRVAQYYELNSDAHAPRQFIRDQLMVKGVRPSPVHRNIAALPFHYVLTTNFDNLMEQAFRDEGKTPSVAVYEARANTQTLQTATLREPLVYKLHGDLDRINTMLVTEDHVIEFLACMLLGDPPLPSVIKGLFDDSSILFIGYGLRDWNIRVMMRAMRGRKKGQLPDRASFAIQKRPAEQDLAVEWESSVMYWDKRENLKAFDMDAVEFVAELKRRFDTGV
jgi:hypothetical protein